MESKSKISAILIFLTISQISIFAAPTIYHGTVLFPDSLKYPYTVTLLHDSVPVLTKNFTGNPFSVPAAPEVNKLSVSSFGYQPVNISLDNSPQDTIVIPPIYLTESPYNLNEVVVTANNATIRKSGINYTISNIKGSYIGNAGSLMDMLSWTPGISVTNNETITVLGRGENPLIYVNGVKVMSQSELRSLTSSNVSKIEVIREPGADYPIGTTSVILITTVKPLGEMINGEVSENAIARRAFSNNFRASTFGKIKNVSFNASLSYNLNQAHQSSDQEIVTFSDTQAKDMTQLISNSDRIKLNSLFWFLGANYITKNKSMFLLQYSGFCGKYKSLYDTERTINQNSNSLNDNYSINNSSSPNSHNIIGIYSTRLYGGTLKLTATYDYSANATDEFRIKPGIAQEQSSETRYKYQMETLQGDYSHKIPSLGKHSFGFYLGYADNSMDLNNFSQKGTQNVTGDSKWAEAYYSISGKINRLSFKGGVRGRYEHNATTENDKNRQTLSYANLAPNAEIRYDISDDYNISASYDLSYELPTFRQINPAMRLSNLIFYTQGNPDLKQSHTNRFNITANIKDFTVITEYYDFRNNIFTITEPYADGMFLRRPENMRRSSDLLLGLEYTVIPNSKFRLFSSAIGVKSHFEYPYKSSMIKSNSYYAELNINASYRFGIFSIFINGRYNSPQEIDNRKLSYRTAVNLGIDCSLLKQKLYMRLEAQDIFNRSITPSWEGFSPQLYQHRINRYDTRGCSLSIRYKFNSAKTKFKQAKAASDTNRLD